MDGLVADVVVGSVKVVRLVVVLSWCVDGLVGMVR